MNEWKTALNKLNCHTSIHNKGIRDKCTAFKSDVLSKDRFRENDVIDFAKQFKLIDISKVQPSIDESVNMRELEQEMTYDTKWKYINLGNKTFELERFVYCRVYKDNGLIEVAMFYVYLRAKIQSKASILLQVGAVFDNTTEQISKIVGKSIAKVVGPTIELVGQKTQNTTQKIIDSIFQAVYKFITKLSRDLLHSATGMCKNFLLYVFIVFVIIAVIFVVKIMYQFTIA